MRLNASAAILRQALIASVTSLCSNEQPSQAILPDIDVSELTDVLSSDLPGLSSSVEAALETLQYLLACPTEDLRRAPDSTLLLGPDAALYLCLLLCLPCRGILGPAFQKAAVALILQIARRTRDAVQSPQDTLNLHAAYLESLVDLLGPAAQPTGSQGTTPNCTDVHMSSDISHLDETTLEAAQVLASGMGEASYSVNDGNNGSGVDNSGDIFDFAGDRNMHLQSLVNLMDMDFFWETEALTGDDKAFDL